MTFILAFSFIGVPPLMGFWAKLFILITLAKMQYFWLIGIIVINSVISIPYYIRLANELGVKWEANLTNFICLAAVILTLVTALFVPVEWFVTNMEAIAHTVGIAL